MIDDIDLSQLNFAPLIEYDGEWEVLDLSEGMQPGEVPSDLRGVGKYNEKRDNMYDAPQYEGKRNIHMGIDLWAPAGEPVYAFFEGVVAYMADNDQEGNYGPTIVTRHLLCGRELYALYGHLSQRSLERLQIGQHFEKGEQICELGESEENGGWPPHLHFQLSTQDPGEADMPGVVADEEREEALNRYPDPRIVLGDLY